MRIALGTDHAGFLLKERVKRDLLEREIDVVDHGTYSEEACDYPSFVRAAAKDVSEGRCDRAIVFGGSGNGEAIVANKERGVRCALCWSEDTAIWSRSHNDANALSLGSRTVSEEMALHIVGLWLSTPFEGGRHSSRVKEIER
ncbi:ribose 5-phosphate isomerase B [bacterium]|nr:ribose 5-phosphate isomerase B [bacterium]